MPEFKVKVVTSLFSKDDADWMAEITDHDDYLVCEIWNNGDGGGNFYIWHDGVSRWGIEAEAVEKHPDADSPMDAWIEERLNA